MRLAPAPAWAPDGTVLYDGVCVLCSAWFRFVAARDPAARFKFVAVQDPFGRRLAEALGIDPDAPDTNAVIVDGQAHTYADAGIAVLRRLPGWSWCGALRAIPRPVRDGAYRVLARNRYRWFGRAEVCMVPDPAWRRHVLDASPSVPPFGGAGEANPARPPA